MSKYDILKEEIESLKKKIGSLGKRVTKIENEKKRIESRIKPKRIDYNEYEDSNGTKTTEYTSIKKLLGLDE